MTESESTETVQDKNFVNYVRQYTPHTRVEESALIFLSSVIEYLTAEVLNLTSKRTLADQRIKITVSDVTKSIQSDEELEALTVRISTAGISKRAL